MNSGWHALKAHGPELRFAWLQVHWAVQWLASFGRTFVSPDPDDGHLSLEWWDGGFRTRPASRDGTTRLTLRPVEMTVVLEGQGMATRPISGITLEDGYDWLGAELARRGFGDEPLKRRMDDLPHHPVGEGAAFDTANAVMFREVARWYAGADHILRGIVSESDQAHPVRCWPHHFDVATLLPLTGDRTIGIGMAPADSSVPTPYWYVNVWPYPEPTDLPDLALGGWHTDGWVGAVLPAPEILGAGEGQEALVRSFLRTTMGIVRSRLIA